MPARPSGIRGSRTRATWRGLLVVARFQDLMRRAAPLMRELRGPLLATAHDYDFIYEFNLGRLDERAGR